MVWAVRITNIKYDFRNFVILFPAILMITGVVSYVFFFSLRKLGQTSFEEDKLIVTSVFLVVFIVTSHFLMFLNLQSSLPRPSSLWLFIGLMPSMALVYANPLVKNSDFVQYLTSAKDLFSGKIGIADVMRAGELTTITHPDFHGPAYYFFHWPTYLGGFYKLQGEQAIVFNRLLIAFCTISALYLLFAVLSKYIHEPLLALGMALMSIAPIWYTFLYRSGRDWFPIYAAILFFALLQYRNNDGKKIVTFGFLLSGVLLGSSHANMLFWLPPICVVALLVKTHYGRSFTELIACSIGFLVGAIATPFKLLRGGIENGVSLESFLGPDFLQAATSFDDSRGMVRGLSGLEGILNGPTDSIDNYILIGGLVSAVYLIVAHLMKSQKSNPGQAVIGGLTLWGFMMPLGAIDSAIKISGIQVDSYLIGDMMQVNPRYWIPLLWLSLASILTLLTSVIGKDRGNLPVVNGAALVVSVALTFNSMVLGARTEIYNMDFFSTFSQGMSAIPLTDCRVLVEEPVPKLVASVNGRPSAYANSKKYSYLWSTSTAEHRELTDKSKVCAVIVSKGYYLEFAKDNAAWRKIFTNKLDLPRLEEYGYLIYYVSE